MVALKSSNIRSNIPIRFHGIFYANRRYSSSITIFIIFSLPISSSAWLKQGAAYLLPYAFICLTAKITPSFFSAERESAKVSENFIRFPHLKASFLLSAASTGGKSEHQFPPHFFPLFFQREAKAIASGREEDAPLHILSYVRAVEANFISSSSHYAFFFVGERERKMRTASYGSKGVKFSPR